MRVTDLVQRALIRAGSRCSARQLLMLDGAVNCLAVGRWMKVRGLTVPSFLKSRQAVFDLAAEEIGASAVLYLEFGVFEGDSIRYWTRRLRNPASKLHGFDSFEGLPEPWNAQHPRGRFSLGGRVPQIDDPRVAFFKGWFDETLPRYTVPPHELLFINIDCDLYSSTKTVLDFVRPHLVPGTYLYFDEFRHLQHELKAFDEFLSETRKEFVIVAASIQMSNVLFRCMK